MYYITPEDCIRILNVNSICDIKPSMLMTIAEQERPFAKNYYNDSNRSDKQREDNVVNGKLGELIVMISLARSGYRIVRGVQFSDANSSQPDDGVDLKVQPLDEYCIIKDIQVKYCSNKFLNFATDRQENKVRENLEYGVVVLVCHHVNSLRKQYILRKLDKTAFEKILKASEHKRCKSYIQPYDIPEFNGLI